MGRDPKGNSSTPTIDLQGRSVQFRETKFTIPHSFLLWGFCRLKGHQHLQVQPGKGMPYMGYTYEMCPRFNPLSLGINRSVNFLIFLPHLLGHFEGIWIFILSTIWRSNCPEDTLKFPCLSWSLQRKVFLVDVDFFFKTIIFKQGSNWMEGLNRQKESRN